MSNHTDKEKKAEAGNHLFPIFLKLEQLRVLIVGGGNIGLEKITAVLNNSPNTDVTLIAKTVIPEIMAFKNAFKKLTVIEKKYEENDLQDIDIVIAATGNRAVGEQIRIDAHKKHILVNIADTPDLCDFYLGSIVQKGDLKIAISTNGKSPTLAKRLKEIFNENLKEEELQLMLNNLNEFRNQLKGDFAEKVKYLNELTSVLINKEKQEE